MESGGNLHPTETRPGPPALPVKQRRSLYSEGSSADMDCEDGGLLSPAGLRQQYQPYTDVFSEPVHCQEAQCPLHQGSVSSCCHQEEVFSECFPPPVPRKKLVRAMSMPEGYHLPTVPRRPPRPPVLGLSKHPTNLQCFDNPLYMLTPLEGAISPEHREGQTAATVHPLLLSNTSDTTSLSQLSFDTPDEQLLPYLLSNAAGVTIAQRHLLFLRSAAHTLEANLLMPGEAGGVSYTPEHFQLCDGYKPRQIGDDIYFKLHCNKFPNKVLGARLYKQDNQFYTAHSVPQTPHVNLQEVLIHFSPSSTQEAAPALRGTCDPQPDCTPSRRPRGGSSESVDSQLVSPKKNPSTIIELLERGHAVSVERDLPQATLEDFFQCRCDQTSDPALYAKQLCILLLQVVTGLQQLCTNGVMYIELRPSNVFLVWPSRAPTASDRAERRMDKEQDAGENNVEAAVQMRWEKLGAPRVVLTNTPYRAISKHYTMSFTNTQIGGLILHGLNPGESLSFVTRRSFPKSTSDPYTERLLDLAGWLQDERSALQLSDTKTILQALLWGPRAQLFTFNIGSYMSIVDSWLTIRRSLLVLKMAERGLLQEGPPLDWEACLCLRYFAFCDGEGLSSASEHLRLLQKL